MSKKGKPPGGGWDDRPLVIPVVGGIVVHDPKSGTARAIRARSTLEALDMLLAAPLPDAPGQNAETEGDLLAHPLLEANHGMREATASFLRDAFPKWAEDGRGIAIRALGRFCDYVQARNLTLADLAVMPENWWRVWEARTSHVDAIQIGRWREHLRHRRARVPSPAVTPSTAGTVTIHAPGGVSMALPLVIAEAGDEAGRLTLEFLTARVANPNTRKAYGRAIWRFCEWCQAERIGLRGLAPPTIAKHFALLQDTLEPASIKLAASALRHWLDYLTERGAIDSNPALSVRTPRLVVAEGKTPVLEREEAKRLLASLDDKLPDGTPIPRTVVELRDRAAIAVMLYNWLRVEALCSMRIGDFIDHPSGAYLVAREKGGKERRLPAHHAVVETLRAYLAAAGLTEPPAGAEAAWRRWPLFQSAPARFGTLSGRRMHQNDMRAMVKRRCKAVGLAGDIGCHSLRATGITTHQENGGRIEDAARLAGHADVRTTALYDRSKKKLERSEVERVQF
jgi:integrase/recombinase XerD